MGVTITLKQYMDLHGYDSARSAHSRKGVLKAAQNAHVPPEKIAKCVMLEDEGGYVLAVCPVTNKVRLGRLYSKINRRLHYANEQDLINSQSNGLSGASALVSEIYDIDVVIDDELMDKPDIYFEVGGSNGLVHVQADDLQHLMQNAEHASFSQPV